MDRSYWVDSHCHLYPDLKEDVESILHRAREANILQMLSICTDFKEFQTDFSFMAGYKDYVALGLNVRGYNKKSFESLSPLISIGLLKNICIIYSYDVSLSKLNIVNKGSHEITLNYFLPNSKFNKNPKIINNPRFL